MKFATGTVIFYFCILDLPSSIRMSSLGTIFQDYRISPVAVLTSHFLASAEFYTLAGQTLTREGVSVRVWPALAVLQHN